MARDLMVPHTYTHTYVYNIYYTISAWHESVACCKPSNLHLDIDYGHRSQWTILQEGRGGGTKTDEYAKHLNIGQDVVVDFDFDYVLMFFGKEDMYIRSCP